MEMDHGQTSARLGCMATANGDRPCLVLDTMAFDLGRAMPGSAVELSSLLALRAAERQHTFDRATEVLTRSLDRGGQVAAVADGLLTPLADVQWAAPVSPTASIFCVGLNYPTHAEEAQMQSIEYPMLFMKPTTTLRGHEAVVDIPAASSRIDYEGEIAIVIGAYARLLEKEDAPSAIAGYALANDISARDWQFRTTEVMIGKAFDGFCPIGPWVTMLGDPDSIEFRTYVNGEQRQHGRATDLIFGFAELVSYLSQVVTLRPGDVILTGTPAGIGATRKPRLWISDGDEVRIESPQLGTLTNRFAASTR
jgi:2-keto-4-pentenoate hydratase/2-oxohepta-3-ene-1,7-dioic acid hydratase in catechol pathway